MTFAHRVVHAHRGDHRGGGRGRSRGVRRGSRKGGPGPLGLLSRDVGDATSDPTRRDPRRLVVDLIDSLTRWELTHQRADRIDIDARVDEATAPCSRRSVADLADIGTPRQMEVRRNLAAELVDVGVSPDLAAWASRLPDLRITPDIAAFLGGAGRPVPGRLPPRTPSPTSTSASTSSASASRSFDAEGRWAQAAEQGLLQDLAGIRRARRARRPAAPLLVTVNLGRRSRPSWAEPSTRWPTRPRCRARCRRRSGRRPRRVDRRAPRGAAGGHHVRTGDTTTAHSTTCQRRPTARSREGGGARSPAARPAARSTLTTSTLTADPVVPRAGTDPGRVTPRVDARSWR